jgi:hypothetical protein
MNRYTVLVFLHVASVIVWLGVGTTVALIAVYARRARDVVVLERLATLVGWLAPRVFAPASLAALGFGIAAAHAGHWPMLFWFHVGEAAFAISFVLNVAIRLPIVRRARRGEIDPRRVAGLVVALAVAELTVLYLAVADMVIKPSSSDTTTLATGGGILALAVLAAVATAFRSGRGDDDLAASADSTESELRRAA